MPLSQAGQEALDKLLADCDAARQDLDKLRTDLGVRLNRIEDPNPPRDLTAAEEAEVTRINAAIDALTETDNQLSLVTLEALDSSVAVREMADSVKAVNSGLSTKLKAVQKTAQQLQDVAKFIGQLDGIVKNLTKVAALFV